VLIACSTKHGAGLNLSGDMLDFQTLHETIHFLAAENGPIGGELSEFVLGLAYEVRHANQGDRKFLTIREDPSRPVVYQSVDLLWPIFLFQLGVLRRAAAFLPTTREHQAVLFQLEFCVEKTLTGVDQKAGKDCFAWYESFAMPPSDYLVNYVSHAALRFVLSASSARARLRNLPSILHSMDCLSSKYRDHVREMEKVATQQNCDVNDLWDFTEWPGFKW